VFSAPKGAECATAKSTAEPVIPVSGFISDPVEQAVLQEPIHLIPLCASLATPAVLVALDLRQLAKHAPED